MNIQKVRDQIRQGTQKAKKSYAFNDVHDDTRPAQMWFQQSEEGLVLFVVMYTLACRWSRCLGCNLPSMVADRHIDYKSIMAQVDHIFNLPEVAQKAPEIRKVILSNNGSVLDEDTFSSTSLMYFIANLNLRIPNLEVLSMETRPEYADLAELEFIARALKEGDTPTTLELAIGFEAFDNHVRNHIFDKGLPLELFEKFAATIAPYGFRLKCYFMLKPVPDMSDDQAVADIQNAIDYLAGQSRANNLTINMHLNPTYVARGTLLEKYFREGTYTPPRLVDVARAAAHAAGKPLSVFIGLSDEGLAVDGGSFIRPGDQTLIDRLEQFNRTQDHDLLTAL